MVHAIGRMAVPDQPRQKVSKTLSQPIKAGCIMCACHPIYTGRVNRRIA
jgi:hypothetical protein